MIDKFRQRSGRVVAASRLVLAAVFLLALLVDENVPHDTLSDFTVTGTYTAWAAFVLVATWRDWWLDFALAVPSLVIDIVAFGAIVYLTTGSSSPYFSFSVFLILSAALRWSWRQTLISAAAVVAVFLAAVLLSSLIADQPLELDRLLVRTANLIVLSLLLIWFGITQERGEPVPRPSEAEGSDGSPIPPVETALTHAMKRIPAELGIIVWWDEEEPWVHVWQREDGSEVAKERFGPQQLEGFVEADQDHEPMLFDLRRQRSLVRLGDGRFTAAPSAPLLLADRLEEGGYLQGVAVNIRSTHFSGELLLAGTDGLCIDHLAEAVEVGLEISTMFDRFSVQNSSTQRAVDRANASLARDLHDGVVQVLSGISFRLEALRSWCRSGNSPEEEISTIQRTLSQEQQNVRRFIGQLQHGGASARPINLVAGLQEMLDQLCFHWKIDCELVVDSSEIMVPAWMEHSIRQMVREATANAVRHGDANTVVCAIGVEDEDLLISISDDGTGFALSGQFDEQAVREKGLAPWSIYERIKSLGGAVTLFSQPGGSHLRLSLPLPQPT
jgi:signal transduction histidine kinase